MADNEFKDDRIKTNSVVQIKKEHGRAGWVGAFVLVTEVKPFGVVGYVHHMITHGEAGMVFIRLEWKEIEYIGEAVLTREREAK